MPSLSALAALQHMYCRAWEGVVTSNEQQPWSKGCFPPFAFLVQPSFREGPRCHCLPSLATFLSGLCLLPDSLFIHPCWLAPQYLCPALQFPCYYNMDLSTGCCRPAPSSFSPCRSKRLRHFLQVCAWLSPGWGTPIGVLDKAQGFSISFLSLAAETHVLGPFP